jgi:F-type H+-transporting ATPase subunit delta
VKTETVVRRYAQSFLEVVKDDSHAHLLQLKAALKMTSGLGDYGRLALNKSVPTSVKAIIWQQIIDSLKISSLAAGFLRVLLLNKRMNLLPKVIEALEEMMVVQSGRQRVLLITSVQLNDKIKAQLAAELESSLGCEVVLQHRTDPKILGGCVVHYNTFMLDGSVRSKLNEIKAGLLS